MPQPHRIETLLTLPLAGRLVSAREISARIGRPAVTFYRWEASGHFPRRIYLNPKCVAWRGDEIQAWMDSRTAGIAEAPAA
jgi:predicted DNA-binding transcriptional regulator AlpA